MSADGASKLIEIAGSKKILFKQSVLLGCQSNASSCEPISFGISVPKGKITDQNLQAFLVDASERCLRVQSQILSSWSDNSAQWLLLEFIAPKDFAKEGAADVLLMLDSDESKGLAEVHKHADSQIISQLVDRKRIEFNENILSCKVFNSTKKSSFFLDQLHLVDHTGTKCHINWQPVLVEETGSIHSTLRYEGSVAGSSFLKMNVRIHCFHSTGLLKFEVQILNSRSAKHPGGIWDLGDPGSFFFQKLSADFDISPLKPDSASYSLDRESTCKTDLKSRWELYQASSGGKNWNSKNHVNAHNSVSLPFTGYQLQIGDDQIQGLRADPNLMLQGQHGSVGIAVPEFWQNFPSRIELNQESLKVAIFPETNGQVHELQGGEQKTSVFWINVDSESTLEELDFVHSPRMFKQVFSGEFSSLPGFPLATKSQSDQFKSYLKESLHSSLGIFSDIERVDEYGWRNFGEIHADHEEQFYNGEQPLISHYNNQFDMILGFLLQYLISGEKEFLQLGDRLARHVIDIDIYHTQQDRAAYNGGLFWFTDHYLHAKTSSHRTYTKYNKKKNLPYGGGPGAEHNFTTGLLLYHYFTGNHEASKAVISLANWVIDMDDGDKSVYGHFLKGYTGLATGSGNSTYHGPARAGGNSMNALLDAWSLTQNPKYLEYAELIIRRCIHPNDNIDEYDLMNIEIRWSYTVFLTSLNKYLQLKIEANQLDKMFTFARDSLLHYASWMVENEKPYFDQRENMEYPTEAWAAQEFRKANVFRLAAAYAKDPLRGRLLDCGRDFSERAWSDLQQFETRTSARALAVLMVEGSVDNYFQKEVAQCYDMDLSDFEHAEKEAFEPLPLRVKSKLRSPKGIAEILIAKIFQRH